MLEIKTTVTDQNNGFDGLSSRQTDLKSQRAWNKSIELTQTKHKKEWKKHNVQDLKDDFETYNLCAIEILEKGKKRKQNRRKFWSNNYWEFSKINGRH